eukprot:CAMPEP_0197418236 /NCGR_PEP_ID=MMETSP1170-20131217/4032_1 /TAXON_ID=54406 /ORGANISM="Sarcinochrysis sp, Strain CCMP770" /LENGTH=268 /DNA_ID=CAMNT_0042945265 /DNA_START=25 /DNA_END=831 /DNA_ORIENTATION=+
MAAAGGPRLGVAGLVVVGLAAAFSVGSKGPAVATSRRAADVADEALLAPSVVGDVKRQLLTLCAAADRGFAASSEARRKIEAVVDDLAAQNPTTNPAEDPGLRRCWKLVYTSAADVSSLNANPLVQCNAIYQDARAWPQVVNVIDTSPRVLGLAPPQIASRVETAARLKVFTDATPKSPTRVTLLFQRLEIEPKKVLGEDLALPSLGFDLPKLPDDFVNAALDLFGTADQPRETPNYFDVRYLDDEFLVIQQASPGGLFVAVAVNDEL